LQPDCLVNSRLGLSIEEDADIDFKTLGDNQLGSRKEEFPWQSPATVAHSWGFHATDDQWKSTTRLLKSLINNVSLNGNFMLNIGPRANGDIPYEISHRLREMGKWLNVNGNAIYGAEAFDLRTDQHDWGKMTCKQTDHDFKLFLHVFNWPLNKTLAMTGITDKPEKIYLLADKQKQPLSFEHSGAVTRVKLPDLQPDPYISVVVAEYREKPEIEEGLVAQTVDGGYSLLPQNCLQTNKELQLKKSQQRESIPDHLNVSSVTNLNWKIYVYEPGEKRVDVSYSFQGKTSGGKLRIVCANHLINHSMVPTGKTVGEPNSDWVIESYESHHLGRVNFPAPGIYEIALELEPGRDEEVNFQWIWIK
jgi:alpha-L-fucosidase